MQVHFNLLHDNNKAIVRMPTSDSNVFCHGYFFLPGYAIAIDGKKVISQANCAVFERLTFNLTSLSV